MLTTPGRTPKQELAQVFKTRWFDYGVPTTGTLRQIWDEYPGGMENPDISRLSKGSIGRMIAL